MSNFDPKDYENFYDEESLEIDSNLESDLDLDDKADIINNQPSELDKLLSGEKKNM